MSSCKDKIGQMLMIGFKGTDISCHDQIAQAISAQEIGGVILFDYDFPTRSFEHNIKSPQQLKHLTNQLQSFAQQAALKHSNDLFPLLIGIDYEGGQVNRLKEASGFIKTLSAQEIGQVSHQQAQDYANRMAETLHDAGINLNFAPVLDVNVNPDNPVIGKLGRSFSHDPQKVADYATIFAKAYQLHGVLCAFKHFPGHGSSMGDTHAGFVDVTQTWRDDELDPYKQLLNQVQTGDVIMTAHVVNYHLDKAGLPATLSKSIITDLLRIKLNYDGVVITDDMQMKAIADQYGLSEAIQLSINAGVDILMFGNQLVDVQQDPKQIINMIWEDVKKGVIAEDRIHSAYQRVVRLKEKIRKLNPMLSVSN